MSGRSVAAGGHGRKGEKGGGGGDRGRKGGYGRQEPDPSWSRCVRGWGWYGRVREW